MGNFHVLRRFPIKMVGIKRVTVQFKSNLLKYFNNRFLIRDLIIYLNHSEKSPEK